MTPLVSVVIPTWNRCDLLADCLASLAAQTYRALEIVVVDDGSTDDTASYVARKHPLARLVRLDRNSGFCVAANAGIRAATGGLVFLLNNDMTLEAGCIARLVEAAEDRTAALFAPLVLSRTSRRWSIRRATGNARAGVLKASVFVARVTRLPFLRASSAYPAERGCIVARSSTA